MLPRLPLRLRKAVKVISLTTWIFGTCSYLSLIVSLDFEYQVIAFRLKSEFS